MTIFHISINFYAYVYDTPPIDNSVGLKKVPFFPEALL